MFIGYSYYAIKILLAGEINRIIDWANSNDIKIRVNVDLLEPNEDTGRLLKDFNISEDEFIEIQKVLNRYNGIETIDYEDELPKEITNVKYAKGLKCSAGRSLFCINWKGEMKACLDLPYSVSYHELGFDEGWKQINEFAENL